MKPICTNKRKQVFFLLLISIGIQISLFSCEDNGNITLHDEIDSLNLLAYSTRYQNIDTAAKYSRQAYKISDEYTEGKAVALNNLAFVHYMLMDYDSSRTLYLKSYDLTKNLITKTVADVGIMKICQITGRNEEFYDYKNDAERKISRIEEDNTLLTSKQRLWYNYAKSEYHFTVAAYYNNIQQENQGDIELQSIINDMSIINSDSAQLANYYLLTNDYDRVLEIGRRRGLTYMTASALQKIANELIASNNVGIQDSTGMFTLGFAQQALFLFRNYGSIYSCATTYLTISDYYIRHGMSEVALDTATKALEFANIQHKRLYGSNAEFLTPYSSYQDSISTEMKWMKQDNITCAWDWIAKIREHLSMVYSSLGMKRQSDYNRNIYLDILNATRQDKQLENQLEVLEQEQSNQNILVWTVALFSIVLFIGLFLYIRFIRRHTEKSYNKDIKIVEESFHKWMSENEALYDSMTEEEKKIDSETYMHEQHIAANKRSYIDKCTSLSLIYSITPFLDRAINELQKLKSTNESDEVRKERMTYLSELIDRINQYNEILSHWIKVRQGLVTLNIENFRIQPLLDTLSKNRNSFVNKDISFHVENSTSVVKADKALTLFMMNTLLDNARKYTSEGGEVKIYAQETENYVEISVTDTGKGLSKEDIQTICHEKVYDSSKIGDTEHDEELKQEKGFGFGLMNCKGIIEKYLKSNPIFSVCTFNIESRVGEGSRFYFRLPKGTLRSIITLLMIFIPFVSDFAQVPVRNIFINDSHLSRATILADSVYYANVDGLYEKAILYADTVIQELNSYYLSCQPNGLYIMQLQGGKNYPEINLWNSGFNTKYNVILDVRNETAVAALALQNWELYRYNNDIYQRLSKLTNFDYSLERSCAAIHKTNITRHAIIIIITMLLLIAIISFLIIYYRLLLLPTFNMRQLMQFNRNLFTLSHNNLVDFIYNGINDIMQIDGLAIGTKQNDNLNLNIKKTENCPIPDAVEASILQSFATGNEMIASEGHLHSYPLILDKKYQEDNDLTPNNIVGVLSIVLSKSVFSESDEKIIRLIVQQLATYLYYSNTKIENQKTAIQLKEDEKLRAEKEESNLHIQNMVLDNCLSAIKHETMYYPNRIKQILNDSSNVTHKTEDEKIEVLNELITYYKDVFTLLSSCAAKQMDNVMFKRKNIPVSSLALYAQKLVRHQKKKWNIDINLVVDLALDMSIIGDKQMLEYMIDNLLLSVLQCHEKGQLLMSFSFDDNMVKMVLSDERVHKTNKELSKLFYPEHLQYDENEDRLIGIEYLVCRQIVREHDEYGGRRGCRINASTCDKGFMIEIMLNGRLATNN